MQVVGQSWRRGRAISRALMLPLATAAMLWGQAAPEPKTAAPPKGEPAPQLAPGAPKTKEEAADAVKPAVDTPAAPVDPKSYIIGPEDIIEVRVWREPEVSAIVQVRPDGKIALPLINDIEAAGLTPEKLKAKLVEALSQYYNKPEVFVVIRAVQSKKYHIVGEVNRTGTFPLVVPITILEALTNAGGFREFANTKKITILRNGSILKFNYNDVIRGKKMEQNIPLQAGDYIVVP